MLHDSKCSKCGGGGVMCSICGEPEETCICEEDMNLIICSECNGDGYEEDEEEEKS